MNADCAVNCAVVSWGLGLARCWIACGGRHGPKTTDELDVITAGYGTTSA